jgi:hypothetical protein
VKSHTSMSGPLHFLNFQNTWFGSPVVF